MLWIRTIPIFNFFFCHVEYNYFLRYIREINNFLDLVELYWKIWLWSSWAKLIRRALIAHIFIINVSHDLYPSVAYDKNSFEKGVIVNLRLIIILNLFSYQSLEHVVSVQFATKNNSLKISLENLAAHKWRSIILYWLLKH